jgi:hypothetical protein
MSDLNEETPQQDTASEPVSLTKALRLSLSDALSLPAETFLVEILLGETIPPVIRCHFYPSPEAIQRAVALFAEYHIVPKPPPQLEETGDAVPVNPSAE